MNKTIAVNYSAVYKNTKRRLFIACRKIRRKIKPKPSRKMHQVELQTMDLQ